MTMGSKVLTEKELADQFNYLYKIFVELGFDYYDAEVLAIQNVPWRDAEALIKQGCPHHLAVQILL